MTNLNQGFPLTDRYQLAMLQGCLEACETERVDELSEHPAHRAIHCPLDENF